MTADPMVQGDRTPASVIVVHAWRLGEQATHLKLHPLDFSRDRRDQAQLKISTEASAPLP